MGRRNTKIPSFNSVGAGQVATVDMNVGPRYHNIKIFYKKNATKATIISHIEMINIKVNGKVIRGIKPAELFLMLEENGVPFKAGVIPIYFSEPWRRNVVSEDVLAWATAIGVSSFQIEIVLAPGATAPTLHGYAQTDNVVGALRDIIKYRRQSVPVGTAGVLTLNTLSKRVDEIYHRIHCFENADGDIADVVVKQDGYEVFNNDIATNDANLADQGIISQSALFSIMFDATQRYDDGLVMFHGTKENPKPIQSWELEFNMVNSDPFTMITEVRGSAD